MAWFALGATVVNAGTAIYSATQQKKAASKAVSEQRNLLDSLKYEPIDIEALKREATATAIDNATKSLALERELRPELAATRAELDRQISSELALQGNLSPDVVNRVTTAGRVAGGRSGIGDGSTVPLTASLLGIESMNLANSRRGAAAGLLGQNDLPSVGLDPGAVASLEVADNAANNQFNIAKAGGESSLINSEAAARNAQIGGQVGMISSLANLLGTGIGAYTDSKAGIGERMTKAEYDKKYATPSLYTPVDTRF